jgi:hypothetical protein
MQLSAKDPYLLGLLGVSTGKDSRGEMPAEMLQIFLIDSLAG